MRAAIALLTLTLLTGAASAQAESPIAKKFDAGPAMQGNGEMTRPMHKTMMKRHRMSHHMMMKRHMMHRKNMKDLSHSSNF